MRESTDMYPFLEPNIYIITHINLNTQMLLNPSTLNTQAAHPRNV